MPGAGLEPACPKAAGFKPAVSDQFHHPGGASLRRGTGVLTPC